MTEQSKRKAGEYLLNHVKLYKYDQPGQFINIGPLIHKWTLTESLNTGYISGNINIYDAVGLLDKFLGEGQGWLKGEEEIEISYTDFFQTTNVEKYFVYAIDNLETTKKANETTFAYKLYFCSKEKFITESSGEIRRGFRGGRISDYVQDVFDQYFESEKPIKIEATQGDQNFVVPNYTPEQTMHFFARKAVSEENPTQTFRFFENREGFYFYTHEEMISDFRFNLDGASEQDAIQQLPTFTKNEFQNQTPEGQIALMSTLIDIKYPKHTNTIEDINQGAYYKLVKEVDFINRTLWFNEYRYLDDYQQYRFPDGVGRTRSKHSKQFVDRYMNDFASVLVLKDYERNSVTPFMRKDTFYPEVYADKNVNMYHHQNEAITIKVYGRNTINAGDLINLQLYDVNFALAERRLDIKRSGFYLVETAVSEFFEEQYIQTLTISKSGYQGEQESPGPYVREPQTASQFTESGISPGTGGVRSPSQAGSYQRSSPNPDYNAPGYPDDLTQGQIEDIIREEAQLRNLDPDVAVEIYRREGATAYQSNVPLSGVGSAGGREASYGPYQLFTGGGLGNEYEQQTGRSLSQDNNREGITNQIRYSLDKAATGSDGWGPWKGRIPAGIGKFDGGAGSGTAVGNWR